jgi:hypothetical protein
MEITHLPKIPCPRFTPFFRPTGCQELEELLRRASEVSERQFFDSYQETEGCFQFWNQELGKFLGIYRD